MPLLRPLLLLLALLTPMSALATSALATEPDGGWRSPHFRDHPLVGRIWDVEAAAFIDEATLLDRLAHTPFIGLGERHDNPDHHLLQARVLAGLVARGRHPAVAMEMLDDDQAAALAAHVAAAPHDAAGLGPAVDWQDSGWPEWAQYQPIAEVALTAGLPLLTANLPRSEVRSLAREGLSALPASRREALRLDDPLPEPVALVQRHMVMEGHCGLMPEAMTEPMVRVQAARDAVMAAALEAGAALPETDGAVLIAGGGHVRTDVAVPWHKARLYPSGGSIAGLGFLEVSEGQSDPAAYGRTYGSDRPPFDYVWFTPVTDLTDPCEDLRARMQKKGKAAE